jgi:hypothetical protein
VGLFTRYVSPPALDFHRCLPRATADNEALHAIFSDPDKFTGAAPFLFGGELDRVRLGPGKLARCAGAEKPAA